MLSYFETLARRKEELLSQRTKCTAFEHITQEDCNIIAAHLIVNAEGLPDRVIEHLKLLGGDYGGMAVDRLEHCLQTATRAYQDGRDEEYVVCALLHDIGDLLGSHNHAEFAATMLQPFVSEKNHWIVKRHGLFQGYYFFHRVGLDRNMRDRYRDHPYFQDCVEFCEKYDQNSFDPGFDSMPLEAFVPMVHRVMRMPLRGSYEGVYEP
jgi:predicted HD phosphohydrolase